MTVTASVHRLNADAADIGKNQFAKGVRFDHLSTRLHARHPGRFISPASRMGEISARTNGVRQQVVTVTGGPGPPGAPSISACEGRSPHGFVDQEAEVAAGIARFIRGGRY